MNLQEKRFAEHKKYDLAYDGGRYGISEARFSDVKGCFKSINVRGRFLDVGCGRGEVMEYARSIGFNPVHGTEVVLGLLNDEVVYAEAHRLPFVDNYFSVVSMLDVIEHLIPGDDELACMELNRVAKNHVIITANNKDSKKAIGEELHINKRPYEEWDFLFKKWFSGNVSWYHGVKRHVSEMWVVDL